MLLFVTFDTNRVADTNKNTNSSRRWTKCDDLSRNALKFDRRFQKRWNNNPLRGFQRRRLGEREQRRIRTTDTRIFSPLLYQLSYLGLFRWPAAQASETREAW
jgi:hypothetical protein